MSSSDSSLLLKYKKNVAKIRKSALAQNLTESEIDEIFKSSFDILKKETKPKKSFTTRTPVKFLCAVFKVTVRFLFLILVLYILLNFHQPTSSIVLRNVQGLIYPSLKILRFLAIPILERYPSLTYLYDETCLLENPYFYVYDMECWPCENVHTVVNLTGFNNLSLYESGIPYIVQTKQEPVFFDDLKKLYKSNEEVFNQDAYYIKSTNATLKTVENLFNNYVPNMSSISVHTAWRINRMNPARLMRSLFPKPHIVPDRAGQAMERYIMIDEPKAGVYTLPNFECSYIFVIQGSGERTIILKPSRECGSSCKTVSVSLKPSYILSYNWWYWRPISLPVTNSTQVSISYLSCYY